MTYLSLFSGAGGFEWFGKLMGWRCVGYVEKDEYCQKVLRARIRDGIFDDAPIFDDVRAFNGLPYRGRVDCVTAGFPCQAFSKASRGRQVAAKDLWIETIRVILETRAPEVFLENVSRRAIIRAARDLRRNSFSPAILEMSAQDLGADHIRPRFWLRAYTDSKGEFRSAGHAKTPVLSQFHARLWEADPGKFRILNGMAARSHRLRALGNGIVPAVAREAWVRLTNGA